MLEILYGIPRRNILKWEVPFYQRTSFYNIWTRRSFIYRNDRLYTRVFYYKEASSERKEKIRKEVRIQSPKISFTRRENKIADGAITEKQTTFIQNNERNQLTRRRSPENEVAKNIY